MSSEILFTIPVQPTGGNFTCTSPAERIYLLTFTSPPDNRLTSAFIDAFLLSLDIIEDKFEKGVVITTSGIPKFYSNGLDIEHVLNTPDFWETKKTKLVERLLRYSFPTIAVSPGHAFAGGLFIALCHDYRFQNPSKGFVCLNEIDIGMAIPTFMMSIVREKLGSTPAFRDACLEGRRFSAKEALESGIVDALGGVEDAVKFAQDKKLIQKANSGPWGGMKDDMYRTTIELCRTFNKEMEWRYAVDAAREEEAEQRAKRVESWEKTNKSSKL